METREILVLAILLALVAVILLQFVFRKKEQKTLVEEVAGPDPDFVDAIVETPQLQADIPAGGHERGINHIIIHCSATAENRHVTVDEIRQWHMAPPPRGRGWKDIAYNYVITRDGLLHIGRDLDDDGLTDDDAGAHAFGWNHDSIGICLVGGADITGRGQANFTIEQMNTLHTFLVIKQQQYPGVEIIGHRDTGSDKDCPSFNVAHWLETGQLIEPRNPN